RPMRAMSPRMMAGICRSSTTTSRTSIGSSNLSRWTTSRSGPVGQVSADDRQELLADLVGVGEVVEKHDVRRGAAHLPLHVLGRDDDVCRGGLEGAEVDGVDPRQDALLLEDLVDRELDHHGGPEAHSTHGDDVHGYSPIAEMSSLSVWAERSRSSRSVSETRPAMAWSVSRCASLLSARSEERRGG